MIADLANGEGLFLTIEESAKIIEKMKKEGYTLKSTEMHNLGTIAFVLFLEK